MNQLNLGPRASQNRNRNFRRLDGIKVDRMTKTLALREQGELCYTISPFTEPRITIDSGESLVVETEDAFSGQIRKEGDRRDTKSVPYPNPLSGPIFVEGARPGGTLAVKIVEITPLIGQGATRILPWWWFYTQPGTSTMNRLFLAELPHGTRICKITDRKVLFSDRVILPYRPMIGTIGTAPQLQAVLSNDPGPHGGNLDLPDVTEGNTIYLPVQVEGALLHLGDVHAIQGEGEFSGAGIEMPARVTISVSVLNEKRISWPRIETPSKIASVACTGPGRDLKDAIHLAFSELILWLSSDYGMDKWEAYQLCGMVSKVQVGNIWTVGVSFPKEYLV